ncbi:MAG TPA: hypothetical protein VG754_01590 [Verrucomicrobiae bacterium]|nr:hypothetical protein [Verrucomicrobiae bacterium]
MKAVCPKCGREIPMEDVNVEKDIALCRSCNQTFSFADLVQESREPAIDLARPPKGVWFKQDMRGFEIGSTTRSPVAFFLVPLMCLWSGGSLARIYGSQIRSGKFEIGKSLFGLPFLLGTIVLGTITLMTIFGKTTVSVQGDQGKVFVGLGPIGWTRRFKWSGVREIREGYCGTTRNGRQQMGIILEGETRLTFGSGMREERRYFIFSAMRNLLHKREG